VGKSRLAAALGDQVTAAGGLALVGHCYALEQSLPYQPVIEMLRSASSLRHADLAPVFRAELVRLAPDILGVVNALADSDERALADRRSQLFEALLQAFLALARGQPLLLIVEDLHWAAESTLDWLAYVAPRLGVSRILVIATYRTSEVGSSHALNRLRRRLAREGAVSALELEPLSAEAVRELVGSLSGLRVEAVGPVADRLYRETAGNPFFLHEIVRGLVEAGQIVVSEGRWEGPFIDETPASALPLPESLRETIGARVGRLTEMARTFAVAAAVTGPVFRYDIVRDAGGWDDERALPALEELLARGFVREIDTRTGFTFGHHLVREVVYADLSAPRRLYWHRRVADALVRAAERLPADQRPAAAGAIVHHAAAAERAE
ncbi:MAG: ATP-binding protein, partial [Vicinamibacterales bacterium]